MLPSVLKLFHIFQILFEIFIGYHGQRNYDNKIGYLNWTFFLDELAESLQTVDDFFLLSFLVDLIAFGVSFLETVEFANMSTGLFVEQV
jgi:hypothetical protein